MEHQAALGALLPALEHPRALQALRLIILEQTNQTRSQILQRVMELELGARSETGRKYVYEATEEKLTSLHEKTGRSIRFSDQVGYIGNLKNMI